MIIRIKLSNQSQGNYLKEERLHKKNETTYYKNGEKKKMSAFWKEI